MDDFFIWLEKYDLLIELIITVLTITLSLVALFQSKNIAKKQLKQEENIAKQQADLQERQIKISVYEQKNEINKALNMVFDIVDSLHIFMNNVKLENLEQDNLYDILKSFIGDISIKNISYTLEQSRFFLNLKLYKDIRILRVHFLSITTSTDCLNLLKDDKDTKDIAIEEIRSACDEIKSLQSAIETAMIEEMKLT
jgi:hypothetical protein